MSTSVPDNFNRKYKKIYIRALSNMMESERVDNVGTHTPIGCQCIGT